MFNGRSVPNYSYISHQVYSARLRTLQKYLDWVVVERKAQRIQTNVEVEKRAELAREVISRSIPRVKTRN